MSTAPTRTPPRHRPFLVSERPVLRRRTPFLLWHLLSLDAPTVAAVWTAFLAHCAGVHLPLVDPLAMFLAVWILYAADRLLDARPLFTEAHAPELRERHRFHHRHRSRFLLGIVFASPALLVLLYFTSVSLLNSYALLATLLAGWLILVHARSAGGDQAHRLPKELAVGVFFPAAVSLPTVTRAPLLRGSLTPAAVLLGCLCCLNCLFLHAWEHRGPIGPTHVTTRWALRYLQPLALATACTAAAAALAAAPAHSFWLVHGPAHPSLPFVAIATSCLLLLALHAFRHKLDVLTLRSLADLVLLTPLLLLLPWLLRHTLHSAGTVF